MKLSAAKALLDLMAKLPTATHGRLYEDYVKPANDLMRIIHIDYISAFHAARKKLRAEDYAIRDPEERMRRQLEIVAEIIWERRQKYEHDRDILRQEAQAYIANLNVIEIKRFFVAVCDYLVIDDDAGHIWIDKERDDFIEALASKGGLSVYATPTTAFLRRIKEARSLDDAAEIINEALRRLNEKYFNVINAYTAFDMGRHVLQ